MLRFDSDYMQGATPEILERLVQINSIQFSGYGIDELCESAAEKIRKICDAPDAYVQFLIGGTQTNVIILDQLLKPWQGVLAAETGHIGIHEAGAVEFTGHEVLSLPSHYGKVNVNDVLDACETFYEDLNHEHMVEPGVLYIAQPSEYGTLYSLEEIKQLRFACDRFNMKLYVDGARMAYGLASEDNDVTLSDLAELTDAFYIGGTKCGALMGEAVVFPDANLADHFFTQVKRHGGLLAKGWILGLQFDVLFTNGLYEKLGKHAVEQSKRIREALDEKGYCQFIPSVTNQTFVILENSEIDQLKQHFSFDYWEKFDENHTVMRFATSWATQPEDIDKLIELL